jgi:hypothetical protein
MQAPVKPETSVSSTGYNDPLLLQLEGFLHHSHLRLLR